MANNADRFREENEHVRHVMKLLVSWYTFFIAINIAAVSWLSTTSNNNLDYSGLSVGIPWFFIVNTILGMIGLWYIDTYFFEANGRVLVKLSLNDYGNPQDAFKYKDESPIPIKFYHVTALLFLLSLSVLLLSWYCISLL